MFWGLCRFDRDTHQFKNRNRDSYFCQWRAIKPLLELSCKAGGLQRRGALKSYISRSFITSSHNPLFPFPYYIIHFIFNLYFMFSGIIEEMATVVAIKKDQENIDLTLSCSFTSQLTIDQSVAHNGVCLTVVHKTNDTYTVTAMKETLDRSNLGLLKIGDKVNVERSMIMNGRLDGHIVQGHVDETAVCTAVADAQGSTYYTFKYKFDKEMASRGYFTVDKGSVTVNGVSLTVCNPTADTFSVAIIPYTHDNTNFGYIKEGDVVNIEFDILGKYIARLNTLTKE